MNVRYRVDLTQYERAELEASLSRGKQPARKLKRAQILLAAHAGVSDEDIAVSVGVGGSTVYRTKRRFVEGNLERALSEEPRPGAARKLHRPGVKDYQPFPPDEARRVLRRLEFPPSPLPARSPTPLRGSRRPASRLSSPPSWQERSPPSA